MKPFSRKHAEALVNREPQAFEVPDWDSTVLVRYFDGAARAEYFKRVGEGANGDADAVGLRGMYRLVMLAVVDERGAPMFTDDDLDLVASLPLKGARKVAEYAASINGLMLDDDEEKSEPSPT